MIQIQHRRGPASEWTSVNPILAEGELGVETDTLKVKLGDGIHDWQHLPYFTQGAVGPANSLTIGTVTSGATSSATITGTAPVQTLNLVLEQGDAATITAGTTTTKLPGTSAEVTNSGDNKNAVFDFKIPRGTTVAVGTTTTGSTSSVAAVTNSGTASDLILDFAIPRGAGVPTGGTAGQILTKNSGTDFDTVWTENYASWTSQVKHRVKAGEALSKGMPVYVTGSNGTNIIVGKAGNGSEATSSKTMGLLQQDLANNATGFVIAEGLLTGLNTSSATAGDPVWLGPTGTLLYGLANKPVAPVHMVFIGIVTRAHATNGEIFVKVQNGFELDELHNVLITSPTNGQSLTYDSATGLWKNSTPASNLDSLTDVTLSSPTDKQVLQYEASSGQWKNKAATGGVTTGATPPATPMPGDAWYDTTDGLLYVYYNDGNSSQWVEVKANSALEANLTPRVATLESRATTVESRATALETADSTTNRSGLVPIVPTSVSINAGTASVNSIGLVSGNGGSTVTLNGVFSTAYNNYKLIISTENDSNPTDIWMQFKNSGSTLSAGYNYMRLNNTANSVSGSYSTGNAAWNLGRTNGGGGTSIDATLYDSGKNLTGSNGHRKYLAISTDAVFSEYQSGVNGTTGQYTDCIITTTNTVTFGNIKIQIYGMR